MPELSQADLDYIKAVNSNDKINSIESKIVNNEAISKRRIEDFTPKESKLLIDLFDNFLALITHLNHSIK